MSPDRIIRFWIFRLARYRLPDGLAIRTDINQFVAVPRYEWRLETLRAHPYGHAANRVWR